RTSDGRTTWSSAGSRIERMSTPRVSLPRSNARSNRGSRSSDRSAGLAGWRLLFRGRKIVVEILGAPCRLAYRVDADPQIVEPRAKLGGVCHRENIVHEKAECVLHEVHLSA